MNSRKWSRFTGYYFEFVKNTYKLLSSLNAKSKRFAQITKNSDALSAYAGAQGGYKALINFSDEISKYVDVNSDYELIPLGCYQIADNNRTGTVSRILSDSKSLWMINGGMAASYACIMLLIY